VIGALMRAELSFKPGWELLETMSWIAILLLSESRPLVIMHAHIFSGRADAISAEFGEAGG
jgi:hypothetical protein